MQIDPYVYLGTNILRNRQDIEHAAKAEAFEREMSGLRYAELYCTGVTGGFDASHVRSIHRHLFQDVYDWAGEFRTIRIWKGDGEFTAPESIEPELSTLCAGIARDNRYAGLPKRETARAVADVVSRLNRIHPFREGNGRTQRVFAWQLARNAGYDLDFSNISENNMRDASRGCMRGDSRFMRYLFEVSMSEAGLERYADKRIIPHGPTLDRAGQDGSGFEF